MTYFQKYDSKIHLFILKIFIELISDDKLQVTGQAGLFILDLFTITISISPGAYLSCSLEKTSIHTYRLFLETQTWYYSPQSNCL